MTGTIRLDRHQVAELQPTIETPNRVTSLSGYAIPTAVELDREEGADEFSIAFDYPGEEQAGDVVRLDSESPTVRVSLSKYTQKVVKLTVSAMPSETVLRRLAERLLSAFNEDHPFARRLSYAMSGAIIMKVMLAEKPQTFSVG